MAIPPESAQKAVANNNASFRWIYIILPAAILLLSIIFTAYFYRLLPGEVAYHFSDGLPDGWMGRGAIVAWTLTPQVFLALLAAAIVFGIIKLGALFQRAGGSPVMPGKILLLMGNMVALPQIIISFAMLDIFSYNAYQIHIMPLWLFALIVMVVGGILLGVLLLGMAFRQTRN